MDFGLVTLVIWVVSGGATLSLLGAVLWGSIAQSRERTREWRAAALGSNLLEVAESRNQITGRSGRFLVRIEPDNTGTEYTIRISIRATTGISLRPEGTGPLFSNPKREREIEIGDSAFDAAFWIEGAPARVLAVLDVETRRLLFGLLERVTLLVRATEVIVWARPQKGARLAELIGQLLDVTKRLSDPIDVPLHLAHNAQHDRMEGVRLSNLLLLSREFPDHVVTREALTSACQDASARIRLHAAAARGAEADAVLLQLADDPNCSEIVAAQAVCTLGARFPLHHARAILNRALRERSTPLATSCLWALGQIGSGDSVQTLVKVLAIEEGELAVAAVEAVGASTPALAEPVLLPALARMDVQLAAAEALGRIGSAAAVFPLKEAAKENAGGTFEKAAREAVAAIQSRLSGASPGQLSLAADEAGQLSIATPETGQVSLASSDTGQISLSEGDGGDEK